MRLPRELRLRVLEYTDLVTPFREVVWWRDAGGFRVAEGDNLSVRRVIDEFEHGRQFVRCWQRRDGEGDEEPPIGCFCSRYHAAASPRCKCWASPRALFQVCRSLYEEANLVFYKSNRFLIIDSPERGSIFAPWMNAETGYPHQTLAASEFLHKVVPRHAMQHLRFLALVYSPFTPETIPGRDHAAFKDWEATLRWAHEWLTLPALTVRVTLVGDRAGPADAEQVDAMVRRYRRLLKATGKGLAGRGGSAEGGPSEGRPSEGVARFYMTPVWPGRVRTAVLQRLQDKMNMLKKEVEQRFMGERYERVAAAEPLGSVWFISHYSWW